MLEQLKQHLGGRSTSNMFPTFRRRGAAPGDPSDQWPRKTARAQAKIRKNNPKMAKIVGKSSRIPAKSLSYDTYSQNTAFSELKIRAGRRPGRKFFARQVNILTTLRRKSIRPNSQHQHFGRAVSTYCVSLIQGR